MLALRGAAPPGSKISSAQGEFLNAIARWLALAALAALSGCATSTLTGRSQLMIVSEERAISGSASAYSSMMGGFRKKEKIEEGTPRAERVREITDRLIAQAVRFRPDVALSLSCMAGGKMDTCEGFEVERISSAAVGR